MKKAISVDKKKPGRPTTGISPLLSARVPPEVFAAVKAWASERKLTPSEAIRRLVEIGLKAKK